eukprot:11732938-Prorocentrum_lima.AAC.1
MKTEQQEGLTGRRADETVSAVAAGHVRKAAGLLQTPGLAPRTPSIAAKLETIFKGAADRLAPGWEW